MKSFLIFLGFSERMKLKIIILLFNLAEKNHELDNLSTIYDEIEVASVTKHVHLSDEYENRMNRFFLESFL